MKKTNKKNKKKGIKTLNNAVRPITSKNKPHFLLTGRLTVLPHFFIYLNISFVELIDKRQKFSNQTQKLIIKNFCGFILTK